MLDVQEEDREDLGAHQYAKYELLAARFQAATVLKRCYLLEVSAHSYIRESQIRRATSEEGRSGDADPVLENIEYELASCSKKIDQHYDHLMRAVGELHRCVIRAAMLSSNNPKIQTLCESFLRLPLPSSPAPGDEVDTLEKIGTWTSATTMQAEADIEKRFLSSIDSLIDLVNEHITQPSSFLN